MGWFRGLSGNELCDHYHQTECNAGTGIVGFEDAIALSAAASRVPALQLRGERTERSISRSFPLISANSSRELSGSWG